MEEKEEYLRGYLEAIEEMSIALEENSIFEKNFEEFKGFLFAKAKVHHGRWWVGGVTYQEAIEARMGRFPSSCGYS